MPRRRPPPAAAAPPWDRGLQPERTLLAWNRTVLAVLVAGAALARWTAQGSTVLGLALIGLVLLGAPAVLAALDRRHRAMVADLRAGRPPGPSHRLVLVVTVLVVGIGGLELVHLLTT